MPGDQQIVSASRDHTIRIFDVASTSVLSYAMDALTTTDSQRLDIWFARLPAIQIGYDAWTRQMTAV